MSNKLVSQSGKIAVVGERELVLGYRLLGVEDAFEVKKEEAQRLVLDLFSSNKYGLVIVGNDVRKSLSRSVMEKLESSIIPLVVFMPALGSEVSEESLARLARRVLGVDLKVNA
jgi:V/A-type H+/Na+-transporting ATPase subunit F